MINLIQHQVEILKEIVGRVPEVQGVRCLVFSNFPPSWALAFLQMLEEVFGREVESLLLEHCNHYDKIRGLDAGKQPTVTVVDALHNSHSDTIQFHVKSLMYQYSNKILAVIQDGTACDLDLPSYLGSVCKFDLRNTVSDFMTSDRVRDPHLKKALLDSMCRGDSALLAHSQKITPKYTLDDLVLKDTTQRRFIEALNIAKNKIQNSYEQGWREKHQRGHNVVLVFNGPSGTGKTMSAEVIANSLGWDLYRIDYSSIQSKFIGEAEKSLKAIFEAARGVKGVLLFDEGDAIFASRTSEAATTTDRYANGEVNFLLQELERFEGVIIISTNLEKNMDDAFMRRFSRVVHFPAPSVFERSQIWKKTVPPLMKFEGDIDFEVLAQLPLTGGNIRNVLVDAGTIPLARGDQGVTMIDLLWAAKRECQKDGDIEFDFIRIPLELVDIVATHYEDAVFQIGADPYRMKHVWDREKRMVFPTEIPIRHRTDRIRTEKTILNRKSLSAEA
jgi:AAA+ superfamily predicted ATPase